MTGPRNRDVASLSDQRRRVQYFLSIAVELSSMAKIERAGAGVPASALLTTGVKRFSLDCRFGLTRDVLRSSAAKPFAQRIPGYVRSRGVQASEVHRGSC